MDAGYGQLQRSKELVNGVNFPACHDGNRARGAFKKNLQCFARARFDNDRAGGFGDLG